MILPLKTCVVRSWEAADVPSLVQHATNRKIWLNLRDRFPHPYTKADGQKFIRASRDMHPETFFAIAVDSRAVGGIGFVLQSDVDRMSAEVGYWLGEPFWGRGIATEAVRAVSQYAFESFDLCRLEAGVFEWNPASMRVLEKAGYSREGRTRLSVTKDGRTGDHVLYGLVRA